MVPEASAAYENTHINTGNQAEDLIAVAMTQVGYTEGENNDTKYCDWMGYPRQAWCAMFISWCADQADIPTTVIKPSAWAHPRSGRGFNVPYYHGSEYTPKRGDLFFKEDFSHVGIVYGVEGEYALTIEANSNDDGSAEGHTVVLRQRKISESYFGVPNYRTCPDGHNYSIKYEPGHPHKRYYYCYTCKKTFYTGSREHVTSCRSCMKCSCSSYTSGYYKVILEEGRLPVYTSHKLTATSGYLEPDELVYVVAASSSWAHIIYANSAGFIRMSSLQRYVHPAADLVADKIGYYEADTAQLSWTGSVSAKDYVLTVLKDGQPLLSEGIGDVTSYDLTDLTPGSYQVHLQGSDGVALSDTVSTDFTVLPTYAITFDPAGGSGGTQEQFKLFDQALELHDDIPFRYDHVLLGWSTEPEANIASYHPGDLWRLNRPTTLYAVWQHRDATAEAIQILSPAAKTQYYTGEPLDTTGLVLLVTYSDGSAKLVQSSFTVGGYYPYALGTDTVTVTFEDVSTTYEIQRFPSLLCFPEQTWEHDMQDIAF